MNSKTLLFSLVILTLFTASNACIDKTKWEGQIEEVDGVTIVKNPKNPLYAENVLEFVEELTIGKAEGKEEYLFSDIRQLTVDDEGYIYALDFKEKHVKVFNNNGEYQRTIG